MQGGECVFVMIRFWRLEIIKHAKDIGSNEIYFCDMGPSVDFCMIFTKTVNITASSSI